MAVRDDDVNNRRLVRQARPPADGNPRVQSNTGRMSGTAPVTTTKVDESGNVRRLWTPGDPWSSDYYFGGES